MSYNIVYTIPFATLDKDSCLLEIEKEGYSGQQTELTAAGTPFVVDIDEEEFIYTPLRLSTATISVVGNDYLQQLFSTNYQQYRVTLVKNGAVCWCGFIKPEIYTQDYTGGTFTLEMECVSAMQTLEHIYYKKTGEPKQFVSLWELLKRCISAANARYTAIYIPHVYAANADAYASGGNVLQEMTVSEQNFFDEDDKAMTLKDILGEICKLLGWTCTDWRGELFFVDSDHDAEYYKYDPETMERTGMLIPTEVNIQETGFSGGDHTLDILPGYNRVTVKCSNYPVKEIIPSDGKEDADTLVTGPDTSENAGDNKYRHSHRVYKFPGNWDTKTYKKNQSGTLETVSLEKYKDNQTAYMLFGAMLLSYCNYETERTEPNISRYNYTTVYQIRQRDGLTPESVFDGTQAILSIKGPTAVYARGAISLNGSYKILDGNDLSPLEKGRMYSGFNNTTLMIQIRIGDYYYMGDKEGWTATNHGKIAMPFERIIGEEPEDGFYKMKNNVTLNTPYDKLDGYIIEIPENIKGDFEFTIYGPRFTADSSGGSNKTVPCGCLLKDFSIQYQSLDKGDEGDNTDRYYENVVNEDFINELSEIELKISSYNEDGACFSKLMLNGEYLTDNLYCSIVHQNIRPEEMLIRRIVNRYKLQKLKLTQEIKDAEGITPVSILSDNYTLDKRFIQAGGSIDYRMNQFKCVMIES